ncbi:hypothetical protein OTK58_19090, partial [Vibrio barjaei]|nr:hypothetical protein [Vibrio barjaei]
AASDVYKRQNKESQNQQAKQPQEKDNTTKASTEKSASASSREQQSQASEEQKQAQLAKETTQQNVDPDLRKLEQIESVRDPSYLLRAQMLLQSKNKEVPTSTGKDW